ncbi:MAG: VWA domain-containing protein [Terracidiphilus sp.]
MKSFPIRSIHLAILVLLSSIQLLSFSQAQVPSPVTAPQVPRAIQDPTRPEIQPRLDLDRDPIPSPDPDVVAPLSNIPRSNTGAIPNSPSPSTAANPAELQKLPNGMYTLHADVDEVLLSCTVIDEKGRSVEDLKQTDFRVWEDGVPQSINSVQHQDLPVSLGILVDNSGSMRDKRWTVNAAAYHLLRASNLRDEAFVVNFSDRAFLDQGFTTDLVALNRGLSRFDSAGTTAMYDAVAAAADELAKHAKLRKQAILIVTDGEDNASHLSLDQTVRRVQNLGGPVVYSIGLLFDAKPEESEKTRIALETLSRETGGVAYFPRSLQDVDGIAAQVARDIRDQYTVDYHASRPASQGGYRVVHVEAIAPNHGRLAVRTRRGYYAASAKQTQSTQEAMQ